MNEPVGTSVVALSVDLMDRSKLSGALDGLRMVRSLAAALDVVDATTVALVDLSRVDDPADLGPLVQAAERVIAYGSHVDDDVLAAATQAGAEALPRSVFFRRLGDGSLI